MTFIAPTGFVAGSEGFSAWYRTVEPPVRCALIAAFGTQRGREATAEAMAWAWEHQARVQELANPVAYLYRVGRSRSRLRRVRVLHGRPERNEPWVEPALAAGMAALSEQQRVTVMLVHGYGWTLKEVAVLLGIQVTTVQSHKDRGLARLREVMEVSADG